MDRIPSGEVIVAAVLSSAVICAAPTVENTANSTVIPMKAMVFFMNLHPHAVRSAYAIA